MPERILSRLLVVALLALAIPVQGMAAVAAAQCMGFGHHQDTGAAGHSHDGGEDAGQADHAHSHDAAAGNDESGNQAHCGPCTACCASASMVGTAMLPLPLTASHAPYAFSQFQPPSVQLAGPDRPPLSL